MDQCGSMSLVPLEGSPSPDLSLGWLVPPAQSWSLPASYLKTQLWPSQPEAGLCEEPHPPGHAFEMLCLASLRASDAHLSTPTPSLNAAGLSSSHSPQPVLLFPRQAVESGLASGGTVMVVLSQPPL